MGRMKEHPRYNVISMRVSDAERTELFLLESATGLSASDIMREALAMWTAAQHRGAAKCAR